VSTLEVRVPGAQKLPVGQSLRFRFDRGGHEREGFVLHHPGGFSAFVNECPHWYVDLDLGDGNFYAPELDRIFCKNHAALFLPDTGRCVVGPCAGLSLERFELRFEGDDALVRVEGQPPPD
jgi:nitrite reductase/ring-hydroxylating ferredoxin subunit